MTLQDKVTSLMAPLVAICSLAGGADAANLLLNASFEADDASSSPFFIRSSTAPQSWTQFGDGVDILHDSYTQVGILADPSDGSHFLDMNQATIGSLLGGVYQDVAVVAGSQYVFSLDAVQWATNGAGEIRYSLIDATTSDILATEDYIVTPTWAERSLVATATSANLRVQVESISAAQAAPGVDNLSLSQVPEPSSCLLIAVSSLAIGLRRRR